MNLPLAAELLQAELTRLERDHYSNGLNAECDGCERAAAVRLELELLDEPRPASEVWRGDSEAGPF